MLSADLRGSVGLHCCRARQQRVGSQTYSPTIHTTTSERQHQRYHLSFIFHRRSWVVISYFFLFFLSGFRFFFALLIFVPSISSFYFGHFSVCSNLSGVRFPLCCVSSQSLYAPCIGRISFSVLLPTTLTVFLCILMSAT